MKRTTSPVLACTLLAASLLAHPTKADQLPGHVDFGRFKPSSHDAEFVEVHVRKNLINMVTRMTEKSEPEVAEILRGLHLVRVNVIGLQEDNRDETVQRVRSIREALDRNAWERIVTAHQGSDDVTVHLKMQTDEAVEGVAVTVIDGNKRIVLVNVVGDIRPENIALIGERFNIEPLRKIGQPFKKRD